MLPQIGPHDADVLEIFDGQASRTRCCPKCTLLDSADAVGGSAATSSLSLQASSISTKLSPHMRTVREMGHEIQGPILLLRCGE